MPLEERKREIIESISTCKTFSVFIHNFDDETIELMQMLKKGFWQKYYKTVFLVFTDEFLPENMAKLKDEFNKEDNVF